MFPHQLPSKRRCPRQVYWKWQRAELRRGKESKKLHTVLHARFPLVRQQCNATTYTWKWKPFLMVIQLDEKPPLPLPSITSLFSNMHYINIRKSTHALSPITPPAWPITQYKIMSKISVTSISRFWRNEVTFWKCRTYNLKPFIAAEKGLM